MTQPNFWEGGEMAQKILKERTLLLESLSPWQEEQKILEEMEILLQLVEEQGDEKEAEELLGKVDTLVDKLDAYISGSKVRKQASRKRK